MPRTRHAAQPPIAADETPEAARPLPWDAAAAPAWEQLPGGPVGALHDEIEQRMAAASARIAAATPARSPSERAIRFVSVGAGYAALGLAYLACGWGVARLIA